MVLARAFMTSQSADAHVILFCQIFEIAETDTGIPVQFFHIHGTGMKSIVADGHRGQALGRFSVAIKYLHETTLSLGLGKFCVELCRNIPVMYL